MSTNERDSEPTSAEWRIDTRAIRAGRASNENALAPTLWPSTTYEVGSLEEGRGLANRPRAPRFYARHGNPSVQAFEEAVAEMEGAQAARAFASGMGAMFAVVFGLCSPGDHVVAQCQLYGGTMQLLAGVCPRFGIDVTFVDGTCTGAFAEAVRPGRTMLVVAETPANPMLDIVDLDEVGALRGPITVVDSTMATPFGSTPLHHGVHLVLHSATKALAGHNDASLGVIAGEAELVDALWAFALMQGANASPFDATNGLRGLRTLGPRLRHQSATALAVATALEGHPAVRLVRYPGLASHPRHDLAARQMRLFGGTLGFEVGSAEAGAQLMRAVRVCRPATSFGGPESIIVHPASVTHAGLSPAELAAAGITPGTMRLSCGLEDADDVLTDLLAALDALPDAP